MNTAGWIVTVFGALAFLGALIGGSNPMGPLFWLGLGLYLIHCANQKKKDEADKEKWSNGGKSV